MLLGRDPNDFELAVFSLLWSEHCGYKHSARLLRRLPSTGERVLQGMDVVQREELEAVKAMAEKARAENERLEARIAELEARLSKPGSAT